MPCLTKPAPARTAPKQLNHCTVKNDIGRRHNEIFRVIHAVKVGNDTLLYDSRRTFGRCNSLNRSILMVSDFVQRRHINTLNLRRAHQEIVLCPVAALGLAVKVGQI